MRTLTNIVRLIDVPKVLTGVISEMWKTVSSIVHFEGLVVAFRQRRSAEQIHITSINLS